MSGAFGASIAISIAMVASLVASGPVLAAGHTKEAYEESQRALAAEAARQRAQLIKGPRRGTAARSARHSARAPVGYLAARNARSRLVDQDPDYRAWLAEAFAGRPKDPSAIYRGRLSYGLAAGRHHMEVGALLRSNGEVACSASLVTPDLVLTAAHCLCGGAPGRVVFGATNRLPQRGNHVFSVEDAMAMPGDMSRIASKTACMREVIGHDIAVLKLSTSVPEAVVNPRARIIRPAKRSGLLRNRTNLELVGFGATEAAAAGVKHIGDAPVINAYCRPKAGSFGQRETGCTPGTEFVASALDRSPTNLVSGTCEGDSGGPAYLRDTNRNIHLVGVASRSGRALQNQPMCGDLMIFGIVDNSADAFIRDACDALGADCDFRD